MVKENTFDFYEKLGMNKSEDGSCYVQIDRYAYVYKCACGATKKITFGNQIHSACGQ